MVHYDNIKRLATEIARNVCDTTKGKFDCAYKGALKMYSTLLHDIEKLEMQLKESEEREKLSRKVIDEKRKEVSRLENEVERLNSELLRHQ